MPKKKNHHRKFRLLHLSFIESSLLVGMSFIIAFILSQIGFFHEVVRNLHGYGYIGVFVTGMFFVSVFTAAPATVILLLFTETLPLWSVALVAGVGAILGDAIILSLMSYHIEDTLSFFPKNSGITRAVSLLRHTKYRFFLTLAGALVVSSPLPDELGLMLMGITKVRPQTALAITFILNTIGIYIVLLILR